jgi:hypothetical protein
MGGYRYRGCDDSLSASRASRAHAPTPMLWKINTCADASEYEYTIYIHVGRRQYKSFKKPMGCSLCRSSQRGEKNSNPQVQEAFVPGSKQKQRGLNSNSNVFVFSFLFRFPFKEWNFKSIASFNIYQTFTIVVSELNLLPLRHCVFGQEPKKLSHGVIPKRLLRAL